MKNARTTFAALALGLMASTSVAPAFAETVWYQNYTVSTHEAALAEVVAAALSAENIDDESRLILSRLIVSEPGVAQYSILDVQYPDDLDTDQILLVVGEDDLTDDDDGWGAVWTVQLELEPRQYREPYVVNSVTAGGLAG